jgi:hypothetical protein
MSYGGKHAAYHRMVDGKKSSYTMPLHPGTLIDAVYIKILQNELKLNIKLLKIDYFNYLTLFAKLHTYGSSIYTRTQEHAIMNRHAHK